MTREVYPGECGMGNGDCGIGWAAIPHSAIAIPQSEDYSGLRTGTDVGLSLAGLGGIRRRLHPLLCWGDDYNGFGKERIGRFVNGGSCAGDGDAAVVLRGAAEPDLAVLGAISVLFSIRCGPLPRPTTAPARRDRPIRSFLHPFAHGDAPVACRGGCSPARTSGDQRAGRLLDDGCRFDDARPSGCDGPGWCSCRD